MFQKRRRKELLHSTSRTVLARYTGYIGDTTGEPLAVADNADEHKDFPQEVRLQN